jgi:hypothetical protein
MPLLRSVKKQYLRLVAMTSSIIKKGCKLSSLILNNPIEVNHQVNELQIKKDNIFPYPFPTLFLIGLN